VPHIAQWPRAALDQWRTTYEYIRNLRRDLEQRELERMFEAGGDEESE
jgi:hypothetical protein